MYNENSHIYLDWDDWREKKHRLSNGIMIVLIKVGRYLVRYVEHTLIARTGGNASYESGQLSLMLPIRWRRIRSRRCPVSFGFQGL